ncbi:MAG TPA: hypothetical protein VK892_17970 [Pyrinomonadaceae bacterium]|nr:hypothetical protein [Pyrinomonadaceae bacterium]
MPVVINEFEVMPEPPKTENQTAGKKPDEKGSQTPEMSDYEVKQMLERRAERLERVSAY